MNIMFSDNYLKYKTSIIKILKNFNNSGILIGNGERNTIKHFDIDGLKINIKSFKQPNPVNSLVYKYFRKSKAKRSFEYAHLLISKDFFTPDPIAYFENSNLFGLTSSYYISQHLQDTITLREVFSTPFLKKREEIIKKTALFMFQLHENGFEFLDTSSANFLIKITNNEYTFFLVDLNRMIFHSKMTISKRLANFARLTSDVTIIKIISKEYASLSVINEDYCFDKINSAALKHQNKRKLKNKLKFYKKLKFK